MKHIFLTYGDNNFSKQKERIKREAENFGFDTINIFSPSDISEDFVQVMNSIRDTKHKGGSHSYWIWKSFFLKKVMDSSNYGDIITYCDSGCKIQKEGKERYFEYVDTLLKSEHPIISFVLTHQECKFTKRDVFDYFGIDKNNQLYTSDQIHSTVIIMIKTRYTQSLIDEYYNIAVTRPDLFTQESIMPNYEEYIDARHDQSVFSLLRKIRGSVEIPDSTILNNQFVGLEHEPFLATRIKW